MAAQGAQVAAVDGSRVWLSFSNPALGQRFAERFLGQTSQILSQVLGQPVTVQVQGNPAAGPEMALPLATPSDNAPPPAPPAEPAPAAAKPLAEGDLLGEADQYAGSAGVRGLTGVSLIEQMLGGEVIKEIDPTEDNR